jgi:hypothetical protein
VCPGLAQWTVRCTRGLQAKLFTFGNSQRRFAIIHRTVRCTTGQCPVLLRRATLNSPASGICCAIIHRTCPVSQRSNDYFVPTVDCRRIECAPARAEVRARAGGTPDSLQGLSGAPPDSQAGPQVRAPTVGTQRPGDVAGAPDCPVPQRRADLNSPASGIRSAIIHRTCPVHTGLSGEPAEQRLLRANGRLQAH